MGVGVVALTFAPGIGCGHGSQGAASDASVDGASVHPVDAPTDVSQDAPPVSNGSDAEIDAGFDATGCSPRQVTVPAFVPPRAPRSACTDTQVQTFFADCFGNTAPAGACDSFKGNPDNSPCFLCMQTDSTDSAWGAVIQFSNNTAEANIGGCIALLDQDASRGSCAVAEQSRELCRHDSCAANCPNSSTPSGDQVFGQCESQDSMTVCAQYVAAAQCDQSVRYTPCLFADFQAYVLGLGRIFCEAGRTAAAVMLPRTGPWNRRQREASRARELLVSVRVQRHRLTPAPRTSGAAGRVQKRQMTVGAPLGLTPRAVVTPTGIEPVLPT